MGRIKSSDVLTRAILFSIIYGCLSKLLPRMRFLSVLLTQVILLVALFMRNAATVFTYYAENITEM